MRTIAVVTVGRSDYGIYRPVLRALEQESRVTLRLVVAGTHLSPEFGSTVDAIAADGFDTSERVDLRDASDSPAGIARSMGRGVMGFAEAFERRRPDLLLVLGDRFEMHAAGLAALPFKIPVAHLHGGELTEGAIDDALRHSLTKLSHLHFVATQAYAARVIQLGEEPWRVTVSGAPALDALRDFRPWTEAELGRRFGVPVSPRPLLVTYHPVTLEFERTAWQVDELLSALEESGQPLIFTEPNADTANQVIRERIRAYVGRHPNAHLVTNFGPDAYFSMMTYALALVGNSSSGIIEAPSFQLPAVNVGTRQAGRVRAANVIDVGYARAQVLEGIRRAIDPAFRRSLNGAVNPYGTGGAAEIIVKRLSEVPLDDRLLIKRFYDGGPQGVGR